MTKVPHTLYDGELKKYLKMLVSKKLKINEGYVRYQRTQTFNSRFYVRTAYKVYINRKDFQKNL